MIKKAPSETTFAFQNITVILGDWGGGEIPPPFF